MQKILLFCLLTLILSYDGGYIHRSFEEKHILVSTSLEIGKKAVANIIKSAFENSTSYKIYPLEIFSQKVSGINFKVVFAGITETKNPSIFTVTIYYPDENSSENLQFKGIVTANEAINKNDQIELVELFLEENYSEDVEPFVVECYYDILFENSLDKIYFLKLETNKDDYAFVYKDYENNFYLSYVIKDLNMTYEIY